MNNIKHPPYHHHHPHQEEEEVPPTNKIIINNSQIHQGYVKSSLGVTIHNIHKLDIFINIKILTNTSINTY